MNNALVDLLTSSHFSITAEERREARPPRYRSAAPESLPEHARGHLARAYPNGLYHHQALALEALSEGRDVCLATPTASGKSLVFQLAAMRTLEKSPTAKVFALYPTKALLDDQLGKWKEALAGSPWRVERIHGSVPWSARAALANAAHVILMTPDILHVWFMSQMATPALRPVLTALKMLVLDEAHAYEGVFGSTSACLVRRLRAVLEAVQPSTRLQVLAATATIGAPEEFLARLTGSEVQVIAAEDDGAPLHAKQFLLATPDPGDVLEFSVTLLQSLVRKYPGRFLVFADSRKMVEQLTAGAHRLDAAEPGVTPSAATTVLSYRAGYEDHDRASIQRGLTNGELRGVVATSALELGVDIGDIDLVVCVGVPRTMKALWQRLGRAGRKGEASCVILDIHRVIRGEAPLRTFLAKDIEPSWLYLDNAPLLYSQALCAARELTDLGVRLEQTTAFASLPERFHQFLANELQPVQPVVAEFFPLKQRAANNTPQYEFPLRSGGEPSYDLHVQGEVERLGEITYAQALREAYPGGVYMHMAKPYRVVRFDKGARRIDLRRAKHATTAPSMQNTIFAKFQSGAVLRAWTSSAGFFAETTLQVSERLVGFCEIHGRTRTPHEYGPMSPHAQRPLVRAFESTGVSFWFEDAGNGHEAGLVADAICRRACERFALHSTDVGSGRFQAVGGLGRQELLRGGAIYDSTSGSLRLTSKVADHFAEILEEIVDDEGESNDVHDAAAALLVRVRECLPWSAPVLDADALGPLASVPECARVVAPGSRGLVQTATGFDEIEVRDVVLTKHGLMYRVPAAIGTRLLAVSEIAPISGRTVMATFDLDTATVTPDGAA